MMLTGRRVGGREACEIGIGEWFVDAGAGNGAENGEAEKSRRAGLARQKTLDAAMQVARQICDGGPGAIAAVLGAVMGSEEEGTGEQREDKAYRKVLEMEDRVEALNAFAEKRKPRFGGV
jgi:methylglutaconyl-CoA hydratase